MRVEFGDGRATKWMQVERSVAGDAAFVEDALVLPTGDRAPRPDTGVDAALERNRRRIRGRDSHDGDVRPGNLALFDEHCRDRQDVAVRAHVRELLQQLVGDGQADRATGVVETDHDHTRPVWAVPGHVVGKCANRLANLVRHVAGQAFLALDPVGFNVGGQSFKLLIR